MPSPWAKIGFNFSLPDWKRSVVVPRTKTKTFKESGKQKANILICLQWQLSISMLIMQCIPAYWLPFNSEIRFHIWVEFSDLELRIKLFCTVHLSIHRSASEVIFILCLKLNKINSIVAVFLIFQLKNVIIKKNQISCTINWGNVLLIINTDLL